ncbi:MAG: homocysteine S-methyltransferase family protein [Clostridia bacterium]|nr:homocysteine S-methyltransferase family protein [Clostridia bacterium]
MRFSLDDKILILDGGMGSLLQARGLPVGAAPDDWSVTHPDAVAAVHAEYLTAGAGVINTNTFGANPLKMDLDRLRAVIFGAVDCVNRAKKMTGRDCVTALDIGPTGRMIAPLGDLDFEDAVAAFRTVVLLGCEAGVDAIFIETMGDLNEARAAVIAAKEVCDLPIFVSFAFGSDGRLFTGSTPEIVATTMSAMGVCMLGANCSVGPSAMTSVASRLVAHSTVPVLIKPNAGMPRLDGGVTVYDVSAEEFAAAMREVAGLGVAALGGCCGTTPEYISALSRAVSDIERITPAAPSVTAVTSYSAIVEIGTPPTVIGERINPTGKKRFKEALRTGDIDYILREAVAEEEAGSHLLDVNVGLPEIDEPEMMRRVVKEIQAVTGLPLVIDTSDPVAMEAALRIYNGKALVNSVSGKRDSIDSVLPLVKKYGGSAICITLDENGIPATAEGRVEIAKKILAAAEEYGIDRRELVFDPLCLTVSTDKNAATETLRAVKMLSDMGLKTSLGVSNVSFGLPDRDSLNATFLTMALTCGLSAAILNPFSEKMMGAYRAFLTLGGMDTDCRGWVAYSDSTKEEVAPANCTLGYAIERGMKDAAAQITADLLSTVAALDIINSEIIPALDRVGVGFENKTVYLPSLISAAEAASSAFEVIKSLATAGAEKNRCTVVIATVEGDIHDIGKNIVKLLLENYGFGVVDLGRDVAPEAVLAAVLENDARIVALSALMTTTVPAMAKTVALIKKEAPRVKIIVGGAVLTQFYADMIGADAYAPDAMGAVRYAESIDAEK